MAIPCSAYTEMLTSASKPLAGLHVCSAVEPDDIFVDKAPPFSYPDMVIINDEGMYCKRKSNQCGL